MDYSDVSSKRAIRPNLNSGRMNAGSLPPVPGPMDQLNVLKNFGEYLGMGNNLLNQNQHLF
jgi:hypothetical protein